MTTPDARSESPLARPTSGLVNRGDARPSLSLRGPVDLAGFPLLGASVAGFLAIPNDLYDRYQYDDAAIAAIAYVIRTRDYPSGRLTAGPRYIARRWNLSYRTARAIIQCVAGSKTGKADQLRINSGSQRISGVSATDQATLEPSVADNGNGSLADHLRIKPGSKRINRGPKTKKLQEVNKQDNYLLPPPYSPPPSGEGTSETGPGVNTRYNSAKPPRSTASHDKSPEFDAFWSAYPRKVGKPVALKAWQRESPDLDTVLAALDWQRRSEQWTQDGGKYIPHPSTWLNQRRWEDEPPDVADVAAQRDEKRKRLIYGDDHGLEAGNRPGNSDPEPDIPF